MSDRTPSPDELSSPDRKVLETWVEEFDRLWDVGRLANVTRFLPSANSKPLLRAAILVGLIQVDLRRQWERGVHVSAESYLMLYPELGSVDDLPAEIVQTEFDVRQRLGPAATWEEFALRFPRQVARILNSAPSDHTRTTSIAHHTVSGDEAPTQSVPVRLTRQFGRYEIQRLLGKGGMGSVYLAFDTALKRPVALKVPHQARTADASIIARFIREARAAATLVHPNICPIYDYGECNGVHYLTMAYIEGKPLSKSIDRQQPADQRWATECVHRLALALAEAHRHGVVHRDLKPSNVILNERGEPIVMDFGLARIFTEAQIPLTQSDVPLGTPAYMAPEQMSGQEGANSPACDIYSLGVMFYELLTGRLPYTGALEAIISEALSGPPEPPSKHRLDLDPRLEAICLTAMAHRAVDRYTSAHELAGALANYLQQTAAGSKDAVVVVPPAPELSASGNAIFNYTTVLEPTAGSDELPPAPVPHVIALPDDIAEAATVAAPPIEPEPESEREPEAESEGESEPPTEDWQPGPRRTWPYAAAAVAAVLLVGGVYHFWPGRPQGGNSRTSPIVVNAPESRGTIAIELPDLGAGAEIVLDNERISANRLAELELATGPHRLKVTGPDIDPIDREFTVEPGQNSPLALRPVYYGQVSVGLKDITGLSVRVDGNSADPNRPLRLQAGVEHRLEVSGPDSDRITRTFSVRPGKTERLDPEPVYYGKATFAWSASPTSLEVLLDGRPLAEAERKTSQRLPVGQHKLEVRGSGVEPLVRSFDIKRGQEASVPVNPVFVGEVAFELSDPTAAVELLVDGDKASGRNLRLREGEHRVRVVGAKYQPLEEAFTVRRGPNPPRKLQLKLREEFLPPPPELTTKFGLPLVLIPTGSFTMGSPPAEPERLSDETPRPVTIERPFYLGVHEVRVKDFAAFVKATNHLTEAERTRQGAWRLDSATKKLVQDPRCTWRTPGFPQDENHPVVCVTWNDAVKFCDWLTRTENRTYRLPTEQEWEYACRAGTTTPFSFGASLSPQQANFHDDRPYGGATPGPFLARTMPVGSHLFNAFKLRDMHGNVWEWCQDFYRKDPTADQDVDRSTRVLRGGSWFDPAKFCRSAYRSYETPERCYPYVGFRVVCETGRGGKAVSDK